MRRNERIRLALTETLAPEHLVVEDETRKHNVPPDSESHWKLTVVSQSFVGQRLVGRHRAIYEALAAEMSSGIHALSLETLTPEEWRAKGGTTGFQSPPCLGGSKAESE